MKKWYHGTCFLCKLECNIVAKKLTCTVIKDNLILMIPKLNLYIRRGYLWLWYCRF